MPPSQPPGGGLPAASELLDLERSQIAHDLHDLLLPLIFGASATVQSLAAKADSANADSDVVLSDSARQQLGQVNDWLREALSLGRNLLTEIYPPELESLPWLMAARDTVAKICGANRDVTWQVSEGTPLADPDLDRSVATSAYRILVEAVRNAVRHGEASAITIKCDDARMVVQDHGKGFDPESVPTGHFGIRAMKGRAALVGNRVVVDSSVGGPTTVTLHFDCAPVD
ncbi:ATP-binding protein [Roseiconus lacunae]|uniref:sensor histidine kinase n=1 Tax=Roseiconus lacunae TaxID=2605694 RepID=UPI00308E7367|nr:ATP-binding protein [Stieleria sp. HD01]